MRDMVFVSHANPEDNAFALWLALRLAAEGYPVWCDLTKLLGGEDFWRDAEDAIRNRTSKFLYVLSRISNIKEGPRNELRIASIVQRNNQLSDFIIPLRLDDISSSEFNIEISRKNATDFSGSWARGLGRLLEKFVKDGVPKDARFSPQAVAEWWRLYASSDQGVIVSPEQYLSNWFPFRIEPDAIQVDVLEDARFSQHATILGNEGYPAVGYERYITTFATAGDLPGILGQQLSVASTYTLSIEEFLRPREEKWLGMPQQRRNVLYTLLREAWERFLRAKRLASSEFANNRKGYFFTLDLLEEGPLTFRGPDNRSIRRALIGHSSVRKAGSTDVTRRYWHFGIEATPLLHPSMAYAMKYRVAFSDDGRVLWPRERRSHRARHHLTRDWWNAELRDRMLAAVSWLGAGRDSIIIPVGGGSQLVVSTEPISFASPVSYVEPEEIEYLPELLNEDEDDSEEIADEQLSSPPAASAEGGHVIVDPSPSA